MFRELSPVGEKIIVKEECLNDEALSNIFPGWNALYYGSGAMALAASLQNILAENNIFKREVILPAYGCPELVSAILFAGGKPVLVDLEIDRTWLSLDDLDRKISNKTAAIIAVDLFGIPERIDKIRKRVRSQNIVIIEDSAQLLPRTIGPDSWAGDIVILSFGRGKPVSVLGGGAILTRKNASLIASKRKILTIQSASPLQRAMARIKCHLYNLLIQPVLYWIPSSIPLLHLGATRFKLLQSVEPFRFTHACLIKANLVHYSHGTNKAYDIYKQIKESQLNDVIDLADISGVDLDNILRYPILIKNDEKRKHFLKRAKKLGLGVSILYGTNLTEVTGIGKEISSQLGNSNSRTFASELITLPVHSLVSNNDIIAIKRLLRDVG